ncbi:MAG: hypothetical protein HYV27_02310 [Candidatus Hydrogenedentes bacterium]|nr:hypothetical protein [Candidatus Hydrogenedentota bacterium]
MFNPFRFRSASGGHTEEAPDAKRFPGSAPDELRRVNLDELDEESQEEILALAVKAADIPRFTGQVEHGYDARFTRGVDRCPKCGEATKRYYANLIYATQFGPRIMFAPAGYFCTACPTVVIDQKLIEWGVSEGFQYWGILGIEQDDGRGTLLFQTWNGEEAAYEFDEPELSTGMNPLYPVRRDPRTTQAPSKIKKQKAKSRKKAARSARKANRKK